MTEPCDEKTYWARVRDRAAQLGTAPGAPETGGPDGTRDRGAGAADVHVGDDGRPRAEVTGPREALERLVEKWRRDAAKHRFYMPDPYHNGAIEMKERCADDLAAVLASCARGEEP